MSTGARVRTRVKKMVEGEFSVSEYLYSLRLYILFVFAFFICSALIGYLGFLNGLFNTAMSWIEQLSENVKDFSDSYPIGVTFLLFFFVILLNNAFTCFIDILLGPLAGVFPLFSDFVNGGLVGWFAQKEGLIILIGIIPHGIFEIPAFLISAAIGVRLGREVFRRRGERDVRGELGKGLKVFLILVLPLLVIAAVIESLLITISLQI